MALRQMLGPTLLALHLMLIQTPIFAVALGNSSPLRISTNAVVQNSTLHQESSGSSSPVFTTSRVSISDTSCAASSSPSRNSRALVTSHSSLQSQKSSYNISALISSYKPSAVYSTHTLRSSSAARFRTSSGASVPLNPSASNTQNERSFSLEFGPTTSASGSEALGPSNDKLGHESLTEQADRAANASLRVLSVGQSQLHPIKAPNQTEDVSRSLAGDPVEAHAITAAAAVRQGSRPMQPLNGLLANITIDTAPLEPLAMATRSAISSSGNSMPPPGKSPAKNSTHSTHSSPQLRFNASMPTALNTGVSTGRPGLLNNGGSNLTESTSLSGANLTSKFSTLDLRNCSGTIIRDLEVRTLIITSTVLLNETTTLLSNATSLPPRVTPPFLNSTAPFAIFITPLPPCVTLRCAPQFSGNCPFPKAPAHTVESTLLVTQKSAVWVGQGQSVGNIFGAPTPSAQPAKQPETQGNQAGSTLATQNPSAAQNPGNTGPGLQSQSSGSDPSLPNSDQQSSVGDGSQEGSQNDPPQSSSPEIPESQQTSSASEAGQDPGGQAPGSQTPEDPASKGPSPGGSARQSGSSEDAPSGGPNSGGSGSGENAAPAASAVATSVPGISSSSGGSEVGDALTPGVPAHTAQLHPETNSHAQNSNAGNTNVNPDQGQSNSMGSNVGSNAETASLESGDSSEGLDDIDSPAAQYSPTVITAASVPISVGSSKIIVGSNTIDAGSLPSTFAINGQRITIQSSQILAPGTTIPLKATSMSPPSITTAIGNVPVVMQADSLAIGTATISRGSSPTMITVNDQTFSWSAGQLAGPETTVALPTKPSAIPQITAGGQIFSVYPSYLKASGTTILIPSTTAASSFVYKGQILSINPSQLVAPNQSITLPPASQPTRLVYGSNTFSIDLSHFIAPSTTADLVSGSGIVSYDGDTLTIQPSQIIGHSTTIALPTGAQTNDFEVPSAIVTGGLTLSLGPSAAIIGSSTYSFLPGQAQATLTDQGQEVTVGPHGIHFGTINVPVPTQTLSYSAITIADATFSVAPSKVVLGDFTDNISSGMVPIITAFNGQTFSIGAQGIAGPSITVPLPTAKPIFSVTTVGDLTFSLAPTQAIIRDGTFSIGSDITPVTTFINGQAISIGPDGILLEGTTVDLPTLTSQQPLAMVTADGHVFFMGSTYAVLEGTTYTNGTGAPAATISDNGETISFGPDGVMLASTTIRPEQYASVIVADGMTFSADATEAVIGHTTYAIGSGAPFETLMIGSQTVSVGSDGIILPSTTVRPWVTLSSGFSSALSSLNFTSTATTPDTLPDSSTRGSSGSARSGVGSSSKPQYSIVPGLILGIFLIFFILL